MISNDNLKMKVHNEQTVRRKSLQDSELMKQSSPSSEMAEDIKESHSEKIQKDFEDTKLLVHG